MSASPERPAQPPPNRADRRHPGRENIGRSYCGITEAARYLDVSDKTIRKAITNGTLPSYGGGRVFSRSNWPTSTGCSHDRHEPEHEETTAGRRSKGCDA